MTALPRIGLIWAQAPGGVIGRDGGMPWHVPEDLAHFKSVTLGSPVVMGRGTWDSLAPRYRPLPGRLNIVITGQQEWSADGAVVAHSLAEALQAAAAEGTEWVWVIGGGAIFAQAIDSADRLEVTELSHLDGFAAHPDDVLGPQIDSALFAVTTADPDQGAHTSSSGIHYRFLRYERRDG